MKGFKTIKISDEFVPEVAESPEFEERISVSSSKKSRCAGRIYFMSSALKELDAHIHWGERCRDNLVEQGGYMLGNVYRDSKTQIIFAIVSHLVPVYGAEGTAAFLDMGTDASYNATLRENKIIEEHENKIRRVGWYHTHPGGLDVFMSGTDMNTQTKSYYHEWQFAVVLNPQKQIWRGFRGLQAIEVDCIMVCDSDDTIRKFLKKTSFYANNGYRWKDYSNDGNSYATKRITYQAKQDEQEQKDVFAVRLNKKSVYIGDCIMAIETFMSCLYNSIAIQKTAANPDSISMDLMLQPHIEGSQLEFSRISCSNYAVNLTEEEQVITKFENSGFNKDAEYNVIHAIVHYKEKIKEEEALKMVELYNFVSDNQLFCIFSREDDETIRFYVYDRDRNQYIGKITY